jgi:hypothetical protein
MEFLLGDPVGYTPSDKKFYQILQLLASSCVGGSTYYDRRLGPTHAWRGTDVALWEVITWFCGVSDVFIRDALIYYVLCRGEAFDISVGRIMGQNRRVCLCVF